MEKAFLQIRVKECERDALRFHWRENPLADVEVLRFTKVLFGLVSSPFLLDEVLEAHLDYWKSKVPEAVDTLKKSLYVDDIISGGGGGNTVGEEKQRKSEATDILGNATFSLHKWASNANELDGESENNEDREEQTAAKQQLGLKPTEKKILGMKWEKKNDTLSVQLGSNSEKRTDHTNLVNNTSRALCHIPHEKHCWSDSTVALWWITGEGQYKQFVANRVAKIRDAEGIERDHVPTTKKPADLGSRGGQLTKLWLKGPTWLPDRTHWPPNLVVKPSADSQSESKATRAILNVGVERVESALLGDIMRKHSLTKTLRIGAWIKRFLDNSRVNVDSRQHGPLTTNDIDQQRLWWIKQVQAEAKEDSKCENYSVQLNLQADADEILKCKGRVQGQLPIYLPDSSLFAVKLVEEGRSSYEDAPWGSYSDDGEDS